ncbi:MAG: hypothetical protein JWO06_85, partial [Bacteroidota bacterium]|nr:hypothetical protein [Bacteroidota bacterium]
MASKKVLQLTMTLTLLSNKNQPGNILRAALLLVLCISLLNTSAEDYRREIKWSAKPQSFSLPGGKPIIQPTFTNARPMEKAGLLPYYTETFPVTSVGNITAQILNPVYVASEHLDDASIKYVKSTVEVEAGFSYYRKQPKAYISFLPFRKNPTTGAIEKLTSFTLRISVVPKPQARSANSYTGTSVLNSGSWYELSVNADGMYKIDYAFVKNKIGIDPGSFNLNTLAIFGNGGGMLPEINGTPHADDLTENATLIVDNNGNNKMDDGDYLLFYGQMADDWKYNSTNKSFYHEKNLYSDNTFYFLTTNAGTGKRVQTIASPGNANKTITDFDDHAYHDNDQFNLGASGRTWVGDKMTSYANTQSLSFNFPNIITSVPVSIQSSVAVNAQYSSSTVVTANGQNVITHSDGGLPNNGGYPPAAVGYTNAGNYNANSAQINITYTFNVSSDPAGSAASYIDWIELTAKRALTLSADAMTFRNASSIGTGNISQFVLANANSGTLVWNVTNLNAIVQMQAGLSGSQLSFSDNTDQLNEYIAFNQGAAFGNPAFVKPVANQNLHGIGQSQMIIISYDDFIPASNDLAAFHKSNDNITGAVIPLSQIYNEFGSGKPDISAIRNFVKMLYDRAGNDTTKMLRYVLLMGDGSFDPKGRITNSNNFVPCYESYDSYGQTTSYTSDDYYGLLDDGEGGAIENGNQQMDIGVGRLPVESETEAADMVTKIKNYKKTTAACSTCVQVATNNSWRNALTFVADYLFEEESDFETSTDGLAESLRAQYPVYNYDKIYVDAYKMITTPAGDRFPDVNAAILNRINTGTLILNWVGHGGTSNWSNARIFNDADIVQLTNQYYPFFITATCDFSRFDLADRTAGESLVINGKGGAIGSLTTVRLVYEGANTSLNNAAFQFMFASYQGRYPTIGEIATLAKNNANTDFNNTRKFVLLGDPALTLDYPRYNIATTFVNNKPVTLPHDTLKALTQITIKGEVRDDNNNKLTSFSGTIYPLVYDKLTPFQTLGNDPNHTVFTFYQYKSLLFKGKATVSNGDFSFTFIVPKDINYQFGNGRISYYADNGSNLDAHGYSTDIIIGGSSDTARSRTDGPKLNVYMNDTKFAFGGTTNANPMLLVELQDPGGINTTGNGLGHDLTAVLDDNYQNKTVLNNYYETALNDFTKGEIKYPFTKLTDGRHTL